jgi:hypothetical protein
MPVARLDVTDALGQRTVTIDKSNFHIGRRDTNDLRLAGSEVSRDHAEIVLEGDQFLLHDRGSRYGTFVNGEQVTERALGHGDRVRLGRGGGAEMVFLVGEQGPAPQDPATSSAIGDLRHVAALLEGLRALGSGRVLDEVLALVLDSALSVSGAERGFIMLAGAEGKLEFKLARARGRITLPGRGFETSRKIPGRSSRRGRRASSPTCSTAISPPSTPARSRSASATCSAFRCASCAIWKRPTPRARRSPSACCTSTAARKARS